MSRKGQTPTRVLLPDPKHKSQVIARFINMVMQSGKKSVAEKIVYGALEAISEKNAEPIGLVEKALSNVAPAVEVKSRRVGGSTYQVPVEVDQKTRGNSLAIRWLISYSRGRGEKTMIDRLAGEILDAANNRGNAVKKKDDTHRMADANKAFAHYRW